MDKKEIETRRCARRLRKISRFHRVCDNERHMPLIERLCTNNGVAIVKVQNGLQFSLREYVINWLPATNLVQVQYRMSGHNSTISFSRTGQPNKPRIIVALEEMISIVRSERPQCGVQSLSAS